MVAAEEGLGFALARWAMVTSSLPKDTLRFGKQGGYAPRLRVLFLVCPRAYLDLPQVARFREWVVAAARDFQGLEMIHSEKLVAEKKHQASRVTRPASDLRSKR